MLLKITHFEDIDGRRLMDIYAESNFENTDYFFPDEKDKKKAVKMVEEGFLDFLKNDYFTHPESAYCIYAENGVWISAARVFHALDDLYYLGGLETHPDFRRQGYAKRLISGIIDELKKCGSFRLYSSVGKRNTPSLRTHESCGFCIVSDVGHDYYYGDDDDREYGLEYAYTDDGGQ